MKKVILSIGLFVLTLGSFFLTPNVQASSDPLYDSMSSFIKGLVEKNRPTLAERNTFLQKIVAMLGAAKSVIPADKQKVFTALYQASLDLATQYEQASTGPVVSDSDMLALQDKMRAYVNSISAITKEASESVDVFYRALADIDFVRYYKLEDLKSAYATAHKSLKAATAGLATAACFDSDCQYIEAERNIWKTLLSVFEEEETQRISIYEAVFEGTSVNINAPFTKAQQDQLILIDAGDEKKSLRIAAEQDKQHEFYARYGVTLSE